MHISELLSCGKADCSSISIYCYFRRNTWSSVNLRPALSFMHTALSGSVQNFQDFQTMCRLWYEPKYGSAFARHSPDAMKITQILQETIDFEGCITPDDPICYSCYKLHLYTLQRLESKMDSLVDALHTCINNLHAKLDDSNTDILTRALLKTALVVAEAIFHQRAMLLPDACEVKFSSRWLLNQLILY